MEPILGPGVLYIIDLLTIQNIAYYRVGISLVRLIFSHKSNKVSRNLDPAVQWSPYWALMGSPHLRWRGAFPPTSCPNNLTTSRSRRPKSKSRSYSSKIFALNAPLLPFAFCWGGTCNQIVKEWIFAVALQFTKSHLLIGLLSNFQHLCASGFQNQNLLLQDSTNYPQSISGQVITWEATKSKKGRRV